jgi:hypothetical protein
MALSRLCQRTATSWHLEVKDPDRKDGLVAVLDLERDASPAERFMAINQMEDEYRRTTAKEAGLHVS